MASSHPSRAIELPKVCKRRDWFNESFPKFSKEVRFFSWTCVSNPSWCVRKYLQTNWHHLMTKTAIVRFEEHKLKTAEEKTKHWVSTTQPPIAYGRLNSCGKWCFRQMKPCNKYWFKSGLLCIWNQITLINCGLSNQQFSVSSKWYYHSSSPLIESK